MSKLPNALKAVAFAVLAGVTTPTVALAQPEETLEQATYRIDIAGRQRMLTQAITGLACLAHQRVDPETHIARALEYRSLFHNSMIELRDGNPETGFPAEVDPRILNALDGIEAQFQVFSRYVNDLSNSGTISRDRLAEMDIAATELFEQSNSLVSTIGAVHSKSLQRLSTIETLLINVAGRQRMLSQRASKDFCLLGAEIDTENNRENLMKTVDLFDTTLAALVNGVPGLIPVPPSQAVADKLQDVSFEWGPTKQHLLAAVQGGTFPRETLQEVADSLNHVRVLMNQAVTLYRQAE